MGELLDLAARCETATATDTKLPREIDEATKGFHVRPDWNPLIWIDEAITLIPEGWRYVLDTASEEGVALVDLWSLTSPKPERKHARATHAAAAICAAALRARSGEHQSPTPPRVCQHGVSLRVPCLNCQSPTEEME